ncbi:MAG: glycosyltransferase family 39 protein, partial [Candidatus Heimdallarchaeota archaeon]|nr:glycosyltransferase family 39 protein [Candidatus Heimdallarchaeota archaeon]
MAKKTPKKQAVSSFSNPMIEGVKATLDTLRVTPQQYPKITNPRTDRLTDLIFVLLIFGIAFWFRLWLRVVFFDVYPDSFGFRPIEDGPLHLFNYFNVESGQEIATEGYADFPVYYIPYVDAFVDGWDPYSGHITEDDKLNAYVYGPFYIYLISIGSYFFDMDPHDSIVYSNLLFDSLTYVMVYVLAKRVTGNVIAFTIALIGSFSPIAIYYSDLKVLNAPQMNFLLLVFLYFYLEKRDNWSMFFLAMATLTKQFPLFMLMPVGFWMARRYGILRGIAKILIFFFFALLLSLPYIVTTFVPYYQKLFLPGGPKTTIKCPEGGEATNLLAGILDLGSCDAYFASGSNASSRDLNLIEFTTSDVFGNLLFSLINSHVLFLGSLFLLAWVGFTGFDYLERNPKLYYRFTAAYMCLAHATIARGIYKYYLTLLVPLILLSLIPGNNKKSLNISVGAMIHKGWKN